MASKRNNKTRLAGLILRWYARHGRPLPWRNTRNPYRILVSETMLQQTQVARVLTKYPEFLRRFPTVRSLAKASLRDVVMIWRGLGHNSRAVRLHVLARTVHEVHDGVLPDNHQALSTLPGIGRYTANALLSFAFGRSVPVVDVNVRRVLSRILWKMESISSFQDEQSVWEAAESLLPAGRAYDWNQALMDLGATICTARTPRCDSCPVVSVCASWETMRRTVEPARKKGPSLKGIPNRIYRGRIMELLRDSKRGMRVVDVGKRILAGYTKHNERWLSSLVDGLERDGLITIIGGGPTISRRIKLA
jgi:A/G-specific adenine glycosylase